MFSTAIRLRYSAEVKPRLRESWKDSPRLSRVGCNHVLASRPSIFIAQSTLHQWRRWQLFLNASLPLPQHAH